MLRKEQEIPSGHDPSLYVTRRIMAPAADGETVPISLLYRKDTPLDGSAPCLLYGYGAYGIAIPAAFSITRLSLGRSRLRLRHRPYPRRQGQGLLPGTRPASASTKANTFSDFIAAAEHLVARELHVARKDRR